MRKFMCVVDGTPECLSALRFAARRAARTGGGVTMLYVIEPGEVQHWPGVAEAMERDNRADAEERLSQLAGEVQALAGVLPEFAIRVGEPVEQVLAHLAEHEDIAVLVLAAGVGDGPGPLVSALVAKRGGRMPVPVTVVPGGIPPERIDAIA